MTNGHFESVGGRLDELFDANTTDSGEVRNVLLHRTLVTLAVDLVESLERFNVLFATRFAF